jgi:outer membrane protein assembly factor BamB
MRRAVEEQPRSGNPVICDWCGAEEQVSGLPCRACNRYTVLFPQWAEASRRRRWFTRRRLAVYGVLLVLLGYVAWANYSFLPDPVTLLFHRPSTSVTSDSLPGQWSMVGRDLQLTRYLPNITEHPVGRLLWTQDLGQPTRSAPTVADGVIYTGGHFKALALDAQTGEPIWVLDTNGPVHYSPAVAGTNLYIGLLDHRLLALDQRSGEVRWESRAQGPITTSPLVSDGIVYFGSSDQFIYALDAFNGNVIWKEEIQGNVRSSVAIYDGKLFATDTEGNLHILNARTGQDRMRFRTSTPSSSAPVPANGLVYFPSGGTLYAVDAGAREIPGQYHFKKVWAQFWVWRIPGIPRPPTQKGGKWRFSPVQSAAIVGSPAVTPQAFYVGDSDGNFFAGDAIKGTMLWRFQAAAGILGSPVVLGDRVYFGDKDGVFYALDRNTGPALWQLSLGASIEIAPVFAEGRLYVRTNDGKLHAIE